MRISLSMLRWLSAGILVLAVLLLAATPVFADTGTYKINNYVVTMEPQNDGRVLITVEQQWQVLSGDIPWVTVGLPNQNFEVKDFNGDVSKVSADNGGGFYGVRVDLNNDFQPGQTFNIKFTVLQGHILQRNTQQGTWSVQYTPGWYDQAPVAHLQVNFISPVSYQTYNSISPTPAVNGNILTWERNNINPGGRVDISVESTDGSFLTANEPKTGGGLSTTFWVVIGIIVVVGLLIFWRVSAGKKEREAYIRSKATAIEAEAEKDPTKKQAIAEDFKDYIDKKKLQPDAQGRYYDPAYGNYMTPWIWAAIISNQNRSMMTPPSSSCVSRPSCVSCACVSCACACACACAGGGAAGCSRKTLHQCRTCTLNKEKTATKTDR